MKHAITVLGIVALVAIAVLVISPGIVPFAVKIAPQDKVPGNTVVITLENGQYIGDKVSSLTNYQLSRLASTQSIWLSEEGLFDGGRLTFGRTEQGQVSDFLEFEDAIFKLYILFPSGLKSEVSENHLEEIEGKKLSILGDDYAIMDTRANMNLNQITLRLFGGFGAIDLTDGNYLDNEFYQGVRINGKQTDAKVRIKAAENYEELSIYSIEYLLNAHPIRGGAVEVMPNYCTRNQLLDPEGMLSPNFDICYKTQTRAASEQALAVLRPLGDDAYALTAINTRGQAYKIPLAQMPGSYGNRGRDFVFVEANNANTPNIEQGDYFLVNSKNDVTGSSHVLRFDSIASSVAYFEDLAGTTRQALFDSSGDGTLMAGDGSYKFRVTNGQIAMDQTNDGSINGGEARFVLTDGSRIDFGPGFTITYTTPSKLFDEPAGDENTQFTITFNDQVDIELTSQGDFSLKSAGEGIKQGMTRYGTLFTWKKESGSDSLAIGKTDLRTSAAGGIYITLERPILVKTPAVCGNQKVEQNEKCDPPASRCAGTKPFERGTCSKDCKSCLVK